MLRSGGVVGGPYVAPSERAENADQQVELIFCNPDLIWRTEFPQPRIGQGAFQVAFQAVYKVCEDLGVACAVACGLSLR